MGPWSGVPRAARARNPTCPSGTKTGSGLGRPSPERPLAEAPHLPTSRPTGTVQAVEYATPPVGPADHIIEATPSAADHPHLHRCPHREIVTGRCGLRLVGPSVVAILAASAAAPR